MDGKSERLNEAYRHVYAYYGIESKNQFAEAVRVQRTAMSAAMNGNDRYLTKNLFIKVCAAFPEVFNLDYLIDGKGTLLLNKEKQKTAEPAKEQNQQNNIIETLAGVVTDVERELADIRIMRSELIQARDEFRKATQELRTIIAQLNINIPMAADENPHPK